MKIRLLRTRCALGVLSACLLLAGCGIVSIGVTNSPPSPNSCAGDGRPSNGVCPH